MSFGVLLAAPVGAASLQPVSNWGASGVPTYISMYIYVPDSGKLAANPPILVVSHFCGGSASQVFSQAQTGGIVAAADQYGFIMIFPQTTNPASSAKCWDVGSTQSLTHDGGGDTQAVAQMVKYTIATYKANPDRVYATGDSSGGMMTEALLAVYPDIFKAGSSFAGVPAGCWSLGWSSASNWGSTCAGSGNPAVSSVNQTAKQWGDKVRAMYPGYSGHRPRAQLLHGDKDEYIAYTNLREGIKEWTDVLGLSTNSTSKDTGLTLGTHQATRERWQNACGYVVLEAITSIGGDHGPSDALFNSSYVIPFLGLDNTDAIDPEVAQCSTNGSGGGPGIGGATSTGGATSAGGNKATGGAPSSVGTTSTGGTKATGGTSTTSGVSTTGGVTSAGASWASGGSPTTGGAKATGGMLSTGGSQHIVVGSSATGGTNAIGGSNTTGGALGTGGLTGIGGTGGTNTNGANETATGGSTADSNVGGTASLVGGNSALGNAGTRSQENSNSSGGCSCSVGSKTSPSCLLALAFGSVLALRRRRRV